MSLTSMDEYRALVESVMRDVLLGGDCVPRVFENSGKHHARVVVDTMLDNARSHVFIYSKNMNVSTFDAKRVRSFLGRAPDARIRVIVESKDVYDSAESALRELKDLVGTPQFQVRYLHGDTLNHITIVDSQHVRIEKNHDERTATVGFGQPDLAQSATKIFDALWPAAQQLKLGEAAL
jgi:hypothetical protein